jgi:4-amino-4-deoxy-L-arabinose transferase-like glycosyltransferase
VAAPWWRPALALVLAVTAFRVLMLALSRAELFVDESQYWFWGQTLDFGYYSKPPAIAWMIRLTTELGQSDSAFWVRLSGPLMHGVTAMLLGAVAVRLATPAAGVWTAAIYLLTPFAALGSATISTDTILAPFYAGAILLLIRASDTRSRTAALGAGLCLGMAFLAKYAALYFLPAAVLAALVSPRFRPGFGGALLVLAGLALVAAPNVIWNAMNDLTTVEHTLDNVGWVRTGTDMSLASLAEFLGAQFFVFGPFAFGALLVALFGRGTSREVRALLLMAVPPLVAVSVQALLSGAYANWALTAYFPAAVAVALWMGPALRRLTLAFGAVVTVVLPLLAALVPWPGRDGAPLLARYYGRHHVSQQILDRAVQEGLPVVASNRGLLADLFYTGRDMGVAIHATRAAGRPAHFYQMQHPRPEPATGPMLYVLSEAPDCGAGPLAPVLVPDPIGGAFARTGLAVYRVAPECAGVADALR